MARQGALPVPVAADIEPSVPAADEGVIARVDFARAWQSLSAAEQEVISLSFWDDLTSPQAGRVLGISSAAAPSLGLTYPAWPGERIGPRRTTSVSHVDGRATAPS